MSTEGIDALGNAADRVFGMIANGAKVAVGGMAGILGASTAVGADFEAQMSTVQAISQASESDMKQLEAMAKKMGATTSFSAVEAGEGLEYMAMAGWKTQDMLDGLPGIIHLAAASGEELGSVSDIVTDAMTAFGMEASEASHFSDVLAQASSNANTNVGMMGETFQYIAPLAGALGYTVDDVAVAIGLMANSSIKGQKAGTSIRAVLTNLAKPTAEVSRYMDALSVSLTDGEGKMKPFRQQIEELRAAFQGLGDDQDKIIEYAAGIAGKNGMSGLLALINSSDKDFDDLAAAIDNSAGAAQRMSEMRLDNLLGDITLLKSALEGTGIEIYGGFSGELRQLTQGVSGWVSGFTSRLKEDMPTIRRQVKEFGKDVKDGFQPVLDFGTWCLKHPNAIKGTLMGIVTAFGAFKGVQAAKDGMKLLGTLSGMVSAWPVAAFGVAAGAIVGIGTAIESAEMAAAKANLAEHFGEITLSMEDLDKAAQHIVSGGGSLFDQLDGFRDASGSVEGLKNSLEDGLREIKQADWKLSLGIDFDEGDTESYTSAVEAYLKNAQDYITSSGYEMKLAVDVVFGGDDADGGLGEGSDAFYQSLYQQLQPLEEGLKGVLSDITENGLDLPKQQIVDGYLQDISEITAMITEAESAAKLQFLGNQYAGMDMLSGDTFQNLQQSIQEYTDEATAGIDESYQKILTSLNAQRLAGERGMEGGITAEEFDVKSADALTAYYEQKAQVIQNGYQAMKDAIMSSYGDEIAPALEEVERQIAEGLPEIMEQCSTPESFSMAFDKLLVDAVESAGMAPDAKDALKLLLENMLPTQEDFEQLKSQMEAAGVSPSSIITDALDDMTQMGAAAGDTESIWAMVGDTIADNEDYSLLVAAVEQQTGQIPDTVMEALSAKNGDIEAEARNMLEIIRSTLGEGVQAEIPVSIQTVTQYKKGAFSGEIAHHAEGGLIDRPTLSWFAEDGPEMAVPLDGSRHAVELWEEAGRILGAYREHDYGRMASGFTAGTASEAKDGAALASPVFHFSPVINISGAGGVDGMVSDALDAGFERFKEYVERLRHEEYRAAL